jgi:uncharacterized protein YigA (DUF484 family)
MPRLELGYLCVAPTMKAEFGFWPQWLDALRGIVGAQANLNGVLHHRTKNFSESVCAIRSLSSGSHQLDDMLASHVGCALFSVLLPLPIWFAAKPVKNVSID